MHSHATPQGERGPAGRTRGDDRLDFHLQTWRERRSGTSVEVHIPQFFSRRSQNCLSCAQAQRSARSVLGSDRARSLCWYLCLVRYFELALPLFPSSFLVFRALSFLSERLLPTLRWKPR